MEVTKDIARLRKAVSTAFDQGVGVEVDIDIATKGQALPTKLKSQGFLATPKSWKATFRLSSIGEYVEIISAIDTIEEALSA